MWAVTGWALRTWLLVTVALGAGVLLAWVTLAAGPFLLAAALAVVAELYLTAQLGKEWAGEARHSWWWPS
jgi:hypothetical protein